jgi:pSer/pThr/pTyr-binding forkhead associated (FHA) protein
MSGNDDSLDWNDEEEVTRETEVCVTPSRTLPRVVILSQVEGPGAPRDFILSKDAVVVGRSAEADIRINSEQVSRKHLLLKRVSGEFSCTDLNSRNGVHLNGVKIHSAVLHDEDTIQIGNVIFDFCCGTGLSSIKEYKPDKL